MENVKKKRLDYLDTAKGFGILFVCMGHACTNQVKVTDCQMVDLIRFVTLFHMSLFFFINGMLYNEKYSLKPVGGIVKKVKAYYLPFVIYNFAFWCLHNVFANLHLISGELDSKDYAYTSFNVYAKTFVKTIFGFRQKFAGAMWFLECLVIISVVFIVLDYIAHKIENGSKRIVLLSLGVAAIVLINHLFNLIQVPKVPSSLSQMVYWGFNGLLFFYLGYLYRYYKCNDVLESNKKILAPVLFLILIIVVVIMRPKVISVITSVSIPVYSGGIRAITDTHNNGGLSLIIFLALALVSVLGIVMTLLFSQWNSISKSKILKALGRYSLHIMCLHFLAFKFVSFIIICIYDLPIERLAEYPVIRDANGLWWTVYTIAGCLLPIGLIKILEKIRNIIVMRYKTVKNKED